MCKQGVHYKDKRVLASESIPLVLSLPGILTSLNSQKALSQAQLMKYLTVIKYN